MLEVFRASRLLAPITSSSYQDYLAARTQQHYSIKLPIKLRKSHDIDSNQYKLTRKDTDPPSIHVLTPINTQQDQSKVHSTSKKFF